MIPGHLKPSQAGPFRRAIVLSAMARGALLVAIATALALSAEGSPVARGAVVALMAAWFYLGVLGARAARRISAALAALDAPLVEDAPPPERVLQAALADVALPRVARLAGMTRLASIRRAQGRPADTLELADAVLAVRLRGIPAIEAEARLLATEALLDANGPLATVAAHLGRLRQLALDLDGSLRMLAAEVGYGVRVATPDAMAWVAWGAVAKSRMAELLPAPAAAVVQGQLALATLTLGQQPLARWLWRRATLLAGDTQSLVVRFAPLAAVEGWVRHNPPAGAAADPPAPRSSDPT